MSTLYPDLSKLDFYKLSGADTSNGQSEEDYRKESSFEDFQSSYAAIFNWENMRYEAVSSSIKNTLGYNILLFRKCGLSFMLSIIHPEDRKYLKKLHAKIFELFYQTPCELRCQIRFAYNIRLIAAEGDVRHILRHSRFTELSKEGKPKLELIESTDISDNVPYTGIHLSVKLPKTDSENAKVLKFQFGDQTFGMSGRELQVLELIGQGFTSRTISKMLFVSIETIKSHRKNILQKTGASSIAEAVRLSVGK